MIKHWFRILQLQFNQIEWDDAVVSGNRQRAFSCMNRDLRWRIS